MTGWRILTNGLWVGGLSLLLAAVSYHLWIAAESGTSRRRILRARSWRWSWAVGVLLVSVGWALSMADAWWEKLGFYVVAGGAGLQLAGLVLQAPEARTRTSLSADANQRPRMCLVAAVPLTLQAFMAPHVRTLSRHYRLTLVSSGPTAAMASLLAEGVDYVRIDIGRTIAPFRDLRSLVQLWWLFRRTHFTVVQSISPKAGLLAMVASRMAGVPMRVHWFTGQIWATRAGLVRMLLKALDRGLAASATDLLADSQSQRQFLVDQRIVGEGEITVLADGSVNGVDTDRFRPDPVRRAATRDELAIPPSAVVLLFVGRLTRDKGVLDLAEAFAAAVETCPSLHLVLVGPDEQSLAGPLRDMSGPGADRFRWVDMTPEPERFMAAADILVLPSRREGFGSSVIEAAACGVPAIGTRIYGLTDAIADGVSGTLVPAGDTAALREAIIALANDPDARRAMGQRARQRVEAQFGQDRLTGALEAFYRSRRS